MYICNSCGSIFEEPIRYRECLDSSISYSECWDGCPDCQESDYDEYEPDAD